MNNQSLREAVPIILNCLKEYQYSKEYLVSLRRHFNHVIDLYTKEGIIYYKEGQYQHFLSRIQKEHEKGGLRVNLFWHYRKCAYYLDEYFRTGNVHPIMLNNNKHDDLSPEFSNTLDEYLFYVKSSIKDSTLNQRKLAIQRYLCFLQSNGHKSFESVEAKDIQKYFTALSEKYSSRTLNGHRLHIRQFHHFLFEHQMITPTWLSLLDFHTVIPRKIQGYLSYEETERIMSAIDDTTNIGKRDYAILSLVKTTGLRGVDIINLKLTDINWRLGFISITQSKTGVKLQLPLLYETGEALKEYILNARPKSDSANVFLRVQAPHIPLKSTSSLDAILDKYKHQSDIPKIPWDGKSFHGVRRGFGRELILADIPVTSVMQILGHSRLDSTKPYIMLHTDELRKCALDFSIIPVERGELLDD